MDKEKVLFLAISAAMLLCAMRLLPRRAQPMEPVTLAAASGLSYMDPALTAGNPDAFLTYAASNGAENMPACQEITDTFLNAVTTRSPGALVLAGGLTFRGARASHAALAEKLRAVEETGVQVLVLPGRGDLNNPDAAAWKPDGPEPAQSVDAAGFEELYADFGFAEAVSRDTASLSYAAQLTDQLRILMIDVYGGAEPGTADPETLLWLRRQLEDARRQGVRAVTVSAPAVQTHGGDGQYLMTNSGEVLDLLRQYSNVVCGFCGEADTLHIGEDGLTEISGSALMEWPNQYGVLSLEGTTAEFQAVSVPLSEDVLDAGWQLAYNAAYRRAGSELAGGATVTSGIGRLCSFFAGVDVRYRAGQGSKIPWDDAIFREWQEWGTDLTDYLQSIQDDGFRDYALSRFRFL